MEFIKVMSSQFLSGNVAWPPCKTWRTNLSNQSCICVRKNTPKSLWIFAVIKRERTWPLQFKKVMIMLLEKTYQQFRVDLFRYKNRLGGTYGDSGDLSPLTFGRRRRLNLRAFFHPPKVVPNHYSKHFHLNRRCSGARISPCLAEFDFFYMVLHRKCEEMLVFYSN